MTITVVVLVWSAILMHRKQSTIIASMSEVYAWFRCSQYMGTFHHNDGHFAKEVTQLSKETLQPIQYINKVQLATAITTKNYTEENI